VTAIRGFRGARRLILCLAGGLGLMPASMVVGQTAPTAEEQAKRLVVMISGQLGETDVIGAGIIVGVGQDRVYVATANHVVRKGLPPRLEEARSLRLQFHWLPGERVEARLLADYDADSGMDLAVLSVSDVRRLALPRLSFDVLADPTGLKRRDQVQTVGYPDGRPWFTKVTPDYLADVSPDLIRFESAYLTQGHSGGAVVNDRWELVGMIKADQPPEGLAVPLDRVIERLRRWNYPVQLTRRTAAVAGAPQPRPAPPAPPSGSPPTRPDEAARPHDESAAAAFASLARTMTEMSAKARLTAFLDPGADRRQLTRELRPSPQDHRKVFTAAFAAKAEAYYASLWDSADAIVAPNAGQTEVLVYAASSEDLKAWNPKAAQSFPGGWKEMGPHLLPGVTWLAFDFVKPGEKLGMAYDGLVLVDGKWRLFPKPWRVLRRPGR
jgi:Trypsin-like peptidase domain